jgi:hypothetical protein
MCFLYTHALILISRLLSFKNYEFVTDSMLEIVYFFYKALVDNNESISNMCAVWFKIH